MIPAQNALLIRWTTKNRQLAPRAPQRGFQSLLLLVPAGFFGLRSLLDSLGLGLDGGRPLRVFYAFDPKRQAVLLIGGDKTGDGRFYEKMIALSTRLWREYLEETNAR